MFTEKDKYIAESLILQHPWISDRDFFDFIGNGGSYFEARDAQPVRETKKMFFCKLTLEDGRLIITCRFIGGNCDEHYEIISYSSESFLLQKANSEEQITYNKITGSGPGMLEEGVMA